ncbi:hypothetical protein A961_17 [Enterococcus faecalis ATCC 29212]|nr:hypothetical protein A961_17 [Enterococcus faecalis ATCC 29212]
MSFRQNNLTISVRLPNEIWQVAKEHFPKTKKRAFTVI